jgi:hypothetical protein
MVADIVSDDEAPSRAREKKKPDTQEQQKLILNNIPTGIENLLDSDSDDLPKVDDGLIEKDLDNWI